MFVSWAAGVIAVAFAAPHPGPLSGGEGEGEGKMCWQGVIAVAFAAPHPGPLPGGEGEGKCAGRGRDRTDRSDRSDQFARLGATERASIGAAAKSTARERRHWFIQPQPPGPLLQGRERACAVFRWRAGKRAAGFLAF
jgi:hypothetical protein